jgi:hypothetical protein
MTRMLWAAVAAAAVAATAGDARAQWGTPPAPMPGYGAPEGCASADRYGWHPILRKALWFHKDGCGRGGCRGKGGCGQVTPPYGVYGGGPGGAYGAPGGGMPGTLVFPNHQFNRSPRDFFMLDVR